MPSLALKSRTNSTRKGTSSVATPLVSLGVALSSVGRASDPTVQQEAYERSITPSADSVRRTRSACSNHSYLTSSSSLSLASSILSRTRSASSASTHSNYSSLSVASSSSTFSFAEALMEEEKHLDQLRELEKAKKALKQQQLQAQMEQMEASPPSSATTVKSRSRAGTLPSLPKLTLTPPPPPRRPHSIASPASRGMPRDWIPSPQLPPPSYPLPPSPPQCPRYPPPPPPSLTSSPEFAASSIEDWSWLSDAVSIGVGIAVTCDQQREMTYGHGTRRGRRDMGIMGLENGGFEVYVQGVRGRALTA